MAHSERLSSPVSSSALLRRRFSKSRDEIAQAYDSPSWWYDIRGFFILKLSYRGSLWSQVRFFARNMKARHLEVAIGSGSLLGIVFFWRWLWRRPKVRVEGLDYAERMLAGARLRFGHRDDVGLHHADVGDMHFDDDHFDSINVANAIHCFPDIHAALREMYRVLKPGGTLATNVLMFPRGESLASHISRKVNSWGQHKGILVTPYEQDDMRAKMQAAGFEVLSERRTGNVCDMLLRKP